MAEDIRYILRIENFKSLQNVELELKPLTFLFGANGSGKSSILKALRFLSANIKPLALKQTIYRIDDQLNLESFSQIVTNNDITKKVIFEIEGVVEPTKKEDTEEGYNQINSLEKNEIAGSGSEVSGETFYYDDEDFTEENIAEAKIMANEITGNENDYWEFID